MFLNCLNEYANLIQAIAAVIALGISVFVYFRQQVKSKEIRDLTLYQVRYDIYVDLLGVLSKLLWDSPYNYPVGSIVKEEHRKYIDRTNVTMKKLDEIEDKLGFVFDEDFTEDMINVLSGFRISIENIKKWHIENMSKLEAYDTNRDDGWMDTMEEEQNAAEKILKNIRMRFKNKMKYNFD